jgi:glycosyltransferase involved in cell wall biosynthesis
MMEQIRNQIENHPYKDRIILFGETSAPEKMYLAMDVFVFPSKYEGTPLTLLEAQISGLPCIASDVITQEAVLSDSLKMLSIKEDPAVWAKEICQVKSFDRAQFYSAHLNEINTYNIKKTVHFLEGLYEQCIEETCS